MKTDKIVMTGETIRKMRNARGLTQSQLAALCNVELSTVSRWEAGIYKPDKRARMKLINLIEKTGGAHER